MDFHNTHPSPLDVLPPADLTLSDPPPTTTFRTAPGRFFALGRLSAPPEINAASTPAPLPEPAPSNASEPSEQPVQQRFSNASERAFGRDPQPRTVCQGITVAGAPCRSFARGGSDYCVAHDPAYAEEMAAIRVAGGQARVEALKRLQDASIGTIQELRDFNAELLRSAAAGHLTPQQVVSLSEALAFHHRLIRDAFYERKNRHP